jgi:anti-anti-sigma regulatory factor
MFEKGTTKHMGIDVLKKLASKNSNCNFVVSHMNDDTREILIKMNIKNIIVPDDGMEIEV